MSSDAASQNVVSQQDEQASEAAAAKKSATRSFTSFIYNRKKKKSKSLTSVVLSPEGIGLAIVEWPENAKKPEIKDLVFKPSGSIQAKQDAIADLVDEFQLDQGQSMTLLTPGSYTLHLLEAPNVDKAEIASALRWKVKELIDYEVEEAVIDYFDIPGRNMRGKGGGMIYAVVTKRSEVVKRLEFFEEANIELDVVDIPELAMKNISSLLPEDQEGVALMHLQRKNGIITVSHDKVLHLSRYIQTGTDDIEVPEAKDNKSDGEGGDLLSDMMSDDLLEQDKNTQEQNLYGNIMIELQRSMDYYDRHASSEPVQTLYLSTISGEVSDSLIQFLANGLGVNVVKLDLRKLLTCDDLISDKILSQNFFTIGLALRVEEA